MKIKVLLNIDISYSAIDVTIYCIDFIDPIVSIIRGSLWSWATNPQIVEEPPAEAAVGGESGVGQSGSLYHTVGAGHH